MKLWGFLGGPGSISYAIYDRLRMLINRSLVQYLIENSIAKQRSRVLEAGSGPAYASSLFAHANKVSFSAAIDIDIEALRICRKRDPKLPVVVGDLYALPFVSNSFDLVWNSSTIEHLMEPVSVLAEMRRVSRPGGHIFVGVPYRYGPLGFQSIIKHNSLGVWIGQVFGHTELVSLLEQSELRPVSLRFYFFRFFIGMLAQRI
jgi:SAM-dependent methyltransferase